MTNVNPLISAAHSRYEELKTSLSLSPESMGFRIKQAGVCIPFLTLAFCVILESQLYLLGL